MTHKLSVYQEFLAELDDRPTLDKTRSKKNRLEHDLLVLASLICPVFSFAPPSFSFLAALGVMHAYAVGVFIFLLLFLLCFSYIDGSIHPTGNSVSQLHHNHIVYNVH